jgi:nitrogen fixation NifU-like protein
MQYSSETLKYYNNMKSVGGFDELLPNVGTGIVGSPICGDVMKLQLVFDNDGIIKDAKYKVFGCVSAIASMELVCELVKGLSLDEAMKVSNKEIADKLKLSTIKTHCSVLGKEAVEAAIMDYLNKKGGGRKFITMSDEAKGKLIELIKENEALGVEIVLSEGGCSGIQYLLRYVEKNSDGLKSINVDEINFFFKEEEKILIDGLNIEVIPDSIGHGFVLTNKNHITCENCTCKCI